GLSWGVAESVVCRTVQKIANLLIKSNAFPSPGKKHLHAGGTSLAVMVVDVTESPVARPQKNSGNTIVESRNATPRKRKSSSRSRRARSSVSPAARDASTIAHCSNGANSLSRKRSRVEQSAVIKGYSNCTRRARPPRRNHREAR